MPNGYLLCVDNHGYEADLTLFRVYQALPALDDEAHNLVRVIDNSQEDYLFGAERFVPVTLPAQSARAFAALVKRLDQAWAAELAALDPEDPQPTGTSKTDKAKVKP